MDLIPLMVSGEKIKRETKLSGGVDALSSTVYAHLPDFWGEIYPVAAGLRPGAIIESLDSELDLSKSFFRKQNVRYRVISAEEFSRRRIACGARPSLDRKPGAYIIYISRDMETLTKIMNCDAADNSVELGLVLGYPSCCVNKFQETKLLLPPVDIEHFKYIPHRPCGPDCAPSLKLEAILSRAAKSKSLIIPLHQERSGKGRSMNTMSSSSAPQRKKEKSL